MKKKMFILFVIPIFILTTFSSCNKKSSTPSYLEIRPVRGTISIEFRLTGSVQPRNRLEIKPQISGRLEKILVSEGDKVKKGDIIAWMSSTDRAALLDIVKTQNVDTETNWEEVYKPTPIIAPIDGFVIARNKEPGQTVSINDVIFVLADKLIIIANVDETDLRHISLGQKLNFFLDAYPDKSFSGTVEHIAYEAQEINNVTIYPIKILPSKTPKIFRSGMTATIVVEANKKDNVLIVPADAVIKKGKKEYLKIKKPSSKNNEEELREVVSGINTGQQVEIVSGITDDDIILLPQTQKVTRTLSGRQTGIPGISSSRRSQR
jgi:macrolide-specific efflux system membrane fusion protein